MGNHNLASVASLSCFSQNHFLSNENMTLKLHMMTHFDMIFSCYSVLSLATDLLNFQKCKAVIYEFGVYRFSSFQAPEESYFSVHIRDAGDWTSMSFGNFMAF